MLQVDAADAPPGSADGAELVHFGFAGLDDPGLVMAVDLTEDVTMCDAAEYYLAVFDVPAGLIPPDADLAGSIVG